MIDQFVSQINRWFNGPPGNRLPSDSAEMELKKPNSSFESSNYGSIQMKSRARLRLVPRRAKGFFTRVPQIFSKAVMLRSGRRSTSPQKSK